MASEREPTVLKELAETLRSIFERIGEFFDLFDLSFFVSGAVAASAVSLWADRAGVRPPVVLEGWLGALAVILTFYVSGLVCFALGRWVRMGVRRKGSIARFDERFRRVLEAHGLEAEEPFKQYLDRVGSRGIWRLYVRLWAEARQSPQLFPSLSLLKRYWVMAATYDGVAMAVLVWALVIGAWSLGFGGVAKLDPWTGAPVVLMLAVTSAACFREAGRYVEYQIEELVAAVAAGRARAKA